MNEVGKTSALLRSTPSRGARRYRYGWSLATGLGLAAGFWVVESAIQVWALGQGTLADQLFHPAALVFQTRVSVAVIMMAAAVLLGVSFSRRARMEEWSRIQRDLGLALVESSSLEQVFRLGAGAALRIADLDCGGVYLVDPDTGALTLAYHSGLSPGFVDLVSQFDADSTEAQIMGKGEPVYLRHGEILGPYDQAKRQEGIRALAVIPIRHDAKVIACLNAGSRRRDKIARPVRLALEAVAVRIGSAVARARAERALRESEERYRAFFAGSSEAVFIATPEGSFVDVNQAALELLGYERDELLALPTTRIYADPGDRVRLTHILRQQGGVRDYEVRMRRKDGSALDVSVTGSVRHAADGSVLAHQCIVRDITRRKEAEEALRASEERYRSLYNKTPVMLHSIDREGRLLSVSDFWLETLGYRREEVLGRKFMEFLASGSRRYAEQIVLPELFSKGVCRDVHFELLPKEGAALSVLLSAIGERDSAGEVRRSLAVMVDVTEQEWAARERTRLEGELRQAQKMEAIGTLASGVAHDFNNSLTAILGYTGLARAVLPETHPVLQSLEMIEQAARQASGVTKALLTFGRKTVTGRAAVDLAEVVRDSIRFLRRMLPASIEIVEEFPEAQDTLVLADAGQLQQVLLNLVINARDALSGGGRLLIALRAGVAGGSGAPGDGKWVQLVVEDDGMGMDEEVQTRIFEPFFTTKPRGQGTGLGMAVTHGIVAEHRGRIEVESALGRGTRVTVAFPACSAMTVASVESGRGAGGPAGHGEVIVVVEDDVHVRSIVSSTLKAQGYEVVQAGDGVEALAALAGEARAVVLDLDLPRMSGMSCLQRIRKRWSGVPVVVVTGDPNFDPQGQLEAGEFLLRKPFRMTELTEAVGKTLTRAIPVAGVV